MTEQHVKRLLSSYTHWKGEQLLALDFSQPLLPQLDKASIFLLSHGTEQDPILNYGNKRAIELWEMTSQQFISTPSRQTAEPMERAERAQFLEEVSTNGYASNYTGIRISALGRRFFIEQATVWNVIDEQGLYCGQAASFNTFRYIDS